MPKNKTDNFLKAIKKYANAQKKAMKGETKQLKSERLRQAEKKAKQDSERMKREKLAKMRKMIDENAPGLLLEVDGHLSWDLCRQMRECGADMFVAGSSSLYQKGLKLEDSVARMNKLVE